jgi:adenylate cyclase
MNEESLRKALKFFECAIEIDPGYAPAYVGIADSYNFLPDYSSVPPREIFPMAREALKTALELDDTLTEAHVSLAIYKMRYEWDWEGAEREALRAIELNPGYAHAHQQHAVHLMFVGRLSEAINSMKKALELDPVSLFINRDYAMILLFAGHVDEAIEQCKKVIERDPTFGWARGFLTIAYLRKSMYEEANAEVDKLRSVSTAFDPPTEYFAGVTCALTGKSEEARQSLLRLEEHSKRAYVPPYYLSFLCFRLGDNDEGFKWLDKAYQEHDPFLCFLKLNQATLAAGSDPRYLEMLKKIGLDK